MRYLIVFHPFRGIIINIRIKLPGNIVTGYREVMSMGEEMNHEMAEVKTFTVGDVVTGVVTKVEEKRTLVSVGYKSEGIIPISELSSLHVEKASDVVKEGDEVELKVIKITEEDLVLSMRAVAADRAWKEMEEKLASKETFEAEVADVVKGGLVVDVGVRGFIPASLVERHFVEDFSDYKGKTLRLKVIEMDKEK